MKNIRIKKVVLSAPIKSIVLAAVIDAFIISILL